MSYVAKSWAYEQTTPDTLTKLILIVLADHADLANNSSAPREKIAQITQVTVWQVRDALNALEEKGFINRILRGTGNNGGSSIYMLNLGGYEVEKSPLKENFLCSDNSQSTTCEAKTGSGENATKRNDTYSTVSSTIDLGSTNGSKKGGVGENNLTLELPGVEHDPLSVPSHLSTPAVIEAWNDWKNHRKEIKKPITPTSAKLSFAELREWGPERWVAAVHASIKGRWTGIYEKSQFGNGRGNRLYTPATTHTPEFRAPTTIKAKVVTFGPRGQATA